MLWPYRTIAKLKPKARLVMSG